MRTALTAVALLAAVTMAPMPVAAEGPKCPPNPLSQAHEPWMTMPGTAVDLRTPPPASAANPLLQNVVRTLPATGSVVGTPAAPINPLTHQP